MDAVNGAGEEGKVNTNNALSSSSSFVDIMNSIAIVDKGNGVE
jgi:hypothetical protein